MLRGKEKILEWFQMCKDSKHIIWKIVWARNPGKTIFSVSDGSDDDEATGAKDTKALKITFDASLKALDDFLSILEPGDYIIMCNNRGQWGKGQREVMFTIPGDRASVGNTQAVSGYTQAQVDKLIADAHEKWTLKHELDEIRKELREAKTTTGDRKFDRFMEAVTPHVGTIVESLTGAKAGTTSVAVTGFHKGKGDTADEQTKLESTLERLNKARPDDILEVLELLTKTAEDNPAMIELLKTQAKQQ